MKREKSARARVRLLLAATAAIVGGLRGKECFAGITFDSTASTVTITNDRDLTLADSVVTSQLGSGKALGIVPVSTSIYPTAAAYQLSNTFSSGASSSIANGSIGQVTNST